jgi:hypothetical protein
VLNGSAPAVLATHEAPFKPTIAVKPVVRRLFTLRAVSWRESDLLRVAQRYTDVDLPAAAAERAIKARACTEMNDPMRNIKTHNQWPGHPDPASCFSLDDDMPITNAAVDEHEPVRHTAFEVVDRGAPFTLRIAGAK